MKTQTSAFEVLGLTPTTDQQEIRAAFVRLARIYHPDRFAGMAADVVEEAERRMKEVTEAYRSLRGAKEPAVDLPPPAPWGIDPMEEARRYREAIAAKLRQEENDRQRWARWDELERAARERAAWESALAAKLAQDFGGASANGHSPAPDKPVLELTSGEQTPPQRRKPPAGGNAKSRKGAKTGAKGGAKRSVKVTASSKATRASSGTARTKRKPAPRRKPARRRAS